LKILSAIVTYNRCDLLVRCIDHVQLQTRKPDALLVINNGSTDGTVALLEQRGVPYVTQENVGSSGGWHRGIQHAIENGFEAVWLMDDDGYPDAGALAALESALVPGVVCASSVVLREDCPTHFVFPFPVLDNAGLPIIFGMPRKLATLAELEKLAPDGTYPFVHFFNGALLSVDVAKQVGNVNTDYFIYGEEVDYFFRLRKAGLVVSVLKAFHFHPDVRNRPYNPMKVYYYIKNSLILNTRYLNHVWLRHVLLLGVILYRMVLRNGFGFVLSLLFGKQAPVFYKAVFRGLQGKVGKDFNG